MILTDTIAAISTANYPSAIGVIRVSGPGTLEICINILSRNNLNFNKEFILNNIRKSLYCDLIDRDQKLDQILFLTSSTILQVS